MGPSSRENLFMNAVLNIIQRKQVEIARKEVDCAKLRDNISIQN